MNIDTNDDLIELPGDLMTDRAAVSIYKHVAIEELDVHIRKGWQVVADKGDCFLVSMAVEERPQ